MSNKVKNIYRVETTDGLRLWVLAATVESAIAKVKKQYTFDRNEQVKEVTFAGDIDVF